MALQWISDLIGTAASYIRIGFAGPRLKNNSGNLAVRNAADGADASVTASEVDVSGDLIVINSDATEAGNDWLLNIQRNAAQTADLTLVAPTAKGTDGYVLRQKAGTGAGILEMELAAAGNTAPCQTTDTTSLAFGDSSPVTMFIKPDDATISVIRVIIDTAFDGTPSMSIGIAGSVSKYMAATQIDMTMAADTVFEVSPGLAAAASETLILTYTAGGATVGALRVEVDYSIPS